ncbi:hypothetical protein Rsub_09097 [Raphidocelis subcapitata]|uniref:Uncharacterized protein n=1 Tax=Raphidocelis subcapitata TaxID=307507 RepID=A0A2V0PBI8_9CHLO|nr:hypothetical protein Rsub_09097 [Raphidocelis subcapitata]|eukprot:GBF96302.1 hypothetical protein Rsub_09097 [Raphidocelis subcapitata]
MYYATMAAPACAPKAPCAALEPTSSAVSSGTDLAASPTASSGHPSYAREWLYRLVMFPSYFTPCHGCCGGNRTPKREQLLTLFDTQSPCRVYCSHCPEQRTRGPWLLQVRRSAFKDVVKASDILRFGCDVAGVQQYTLNGSKVLYLNREAAPDRKGAPTAAAPATCSVDGRAMMDKNSQYCSLKCKMHGEDPEFGEWLDLQDPSVRAAAYAAAIAPPRPTVACKRAAPNGCPYSYGGGPAGSGAASPASSGGSGVGAGGGAGSSARSRKAPRNGATEAAGPGGAVAAKAPRPPIKIKVSPPRDAAPGGAAAGGRFAASAAHHSAFLAAATDGPVLGEWMADGPLAGLDGALSCTADWAAFASHADAAAVAAAEPDWPAAAAGDAAGEWWLPDDAEAEAAAAAPLACAGGAAALDEADADAALLLEWPAARGAPLGAGTSELLQYGSGASSPGSDAPIDGFFSWDC